MKTGWKKRILGAGTLSSLGAILTAITLYEIYEDVVVQSNPLSLTVLENSIPLLLNLALVAAGIAIVRTEDLETDFVTRTTGWALLGAGTLFAITAWVYSFQVLQGEIKPHLLFSHVISMGTVAGLAVGVYDSQRRQREAQLQAEHDKISALFENSSDCIAEIEFVDEEPVVSDINPAFRRVFGFERDEIVGKSIDEVIVPPDDDQKAGAISHRAKRGEQFDIEEVFRRTADGDVRVFRLQAVPLHATSWDADGYAVYTDITPEYQYEQRLTALHEATRELVAVGSIEDIAVATVHAAEEILELDATGIHLYDPDEHVLRPAAYTDRIDDLIDTLPTFGPGEAIAWEVFESNSPRYVSDLHTVDGAHNEDSPLRSELLLPLEGFGVLMIGARAPDAFDDSEFSLAKILAANVEAAMERAERERRLEQQNERLETFSSIVSHDLRNPLGIAMGYLELAREGDDAAFDRIEHALDRMDTLIEDLLTLARQGESIDEVTRVDLDRIARTAWENTATERATLEVENVGEIEADPDRLQQLLENLFTNAVEHGDSAVTVRVAGTDSGFVVEDDGPGIPADDRERVLEQGYTTDDGGTGFGLAIVDEIAGAHGWTLHVEESSSGGARFVFETDE